MYEKFGQFIDGKWQQAEKKETYDVINPATEEVIGKASKASSIEVQKACLLYTSPSPRDGLLSRMPSSA